MTRRILAVVAGFVLFNAIVIAAEALGGRIFPAPAFDPHDAAAMKAALAALPAAALLLVLAGWAVASFAGGFLTARLASKRSPALVLGALGTVIGVVNNLGVPPPAWFWALTFVCFLPPAYAASRLAVPPTQAA